MSLLQGRRANPSVTSDNCAAAVAGGADAAPAAPTEVAGAASAADAAVPADVAVAAPSAAPSSSVTVQPPLLLFNMDPRALTRLTTPVAYAITALILVMLLLLDSLCEGEKKHAYTFTALVQFLRGSPELTTSIEEDLKKKSRDTVSPDDVADCSTYNGTVSSGMVPYRVIYPGASVIG